MSVVTSTRWLAQVLSTQPGMLSGALLIFTLSRFFLANTVATDSGWSSGGRVDWTTDSLLRRSKQAKKGGKLIWQHDVLDCQPCLWCCWCWSLAPVSPDVSTLSPWCQLSVLLWWCVMLPCLPTAFLALTSPFIKGWQYLHPFVTTSFNIVSQYNKRWRLRELHLYQNKRNKQ